MKINWKLHEEIRTQDCSSLSELCQCEDSSKATFHASVGEIFMPITWANIQEPEADRMFISRRLHVLGQNSLVEDLITTGCQLCGTPVNGTIGYVEGLSVLLFLSFFGSQHNTYYTHNLGFGRSNVDQDTIPLYCQRSSDRLHVIATIYRPFLVQVLYNCDPHPW